MDVTNRTIIVGAALISIFFVFLVILLAWGAPDESIGRLSDLAGYMDDHNTNGAKLIITFGGLILVLLAGLVILFEISPPETGSIRVAQAGGGQASIAGEDVSQRIEDELRGLPQLSGVQASVTARGRKAEIKLDLYVGADADLAATTDEMIRRARELVEGRMGIELDGAPKAQIHYRELRVAAPAPAPPGPMSAPPPPQFGAEASHEPAETTEQAPPA